MFSVISKFWNLLRFENAKINYEKQLERELAFLDEEIKNEDTIEHRIKDTNTKAKIEQEETEKNCFRKRGIVTLVDSNHAVIDNCYAFDILKTNHTYEELKKGSRVEYLAYKPFESDNLKIVKIERTLFSSWEEEADKHIEQEISELNTKAPEYFNTHQRSILGVIILKRGSLITVDTDYEKLEVDLDTVSSEIIFQVNDRVYLNCKVQTDTSFVDSAGEILEVLSIHPARLCNIKEMVTDVNESWGTIGNNCFFTFDILPMKYIPNVGDKVSADVIENEGKKFLWRCVKIVLLEKAEELSQKQKVENEHSLFLNKNGIMITNDIKYTFKNLFDELEQEIIMTNESDTAQKVIKLYFMGKKSQSQLTLLSPRMNEPFLIGPKESKILRLKGYAKFYGLCEEIFVIQFVGFKIGRKISIEVECKNDEANSENARKNYGNLNLKKSGRHTLEIWKKKEFIVHGERISVKNHFVANRIGGFEVPQRLKNVVLGIESKIRRDEEIEKMFPVLKEHLSLDTYVHKFQLLLHLEEIQYFENIRRYDCERAHFTKENEYLALEIENLAEKRPSLVIGDSIMAENPWSENEVKRSYEGIIHKVMFNRILLKFNSTFHEKYNGEDYKLTFYFSRTRFRKQHYAIDKVFQQMKKEILFPTKIIVNKDIQLDASLAEDENLFIKNYSKEVKWFNQNLNSIQKIAVKNILRGEARPMPYIVFGPPGTGKTTTLIEVILQLVTLLPNCRLLVGTPSNSSADLIATRLMKSEVLQPGDFVRVVSQNLIEKELIPDHLKPYCATLDIGMQDRSSSCMIVTESGIKLKCQANHIGRHRITIGTCLTLGTLLQMSFPLGHFTHLIIDEAGQCTEPETMVCVSQIGQNSGQIVLAGDPMQLGPVVLNTYAHQYGLERTLLLRMLSYSPYLKDKERFPPIGYDSRLVTKLLYNYRSIPSILKSYNDLFYGSELLPKINETDSREIQILRHLQDILPESERRSPNHGVFFIGTLGENCQDADSPSWYNAAEAKNVVLFLIKLYKKQISPMNIGIITPYQKQVRTIRNILMEADIVLPKIGSIEEFQGQERDIVLISTVRSQKSLVQMDIKYSLGFVQSATRMNVAISRSRSLTVIFGNPHLLIQDSFWKKLIQYCVDNDAYYGCHLPSELN